MLIETKSHTHVTDSGSDSGINYRRNVSYGGGTVGAFGTDAAKTDV